MDKRIAHYKKTIHKWITNRSDGILVVAGGKNDRDVFKELGFKNVTISNIDERLNGNDFLPYKWSCQDVENLSFEDSSFDFVVVHAALHHCRSPHRALLEMYRVAKRGIIMFESRDSFIMRILIYFGLTESHEHVNVYYHSCKKGGIRNTDIPNFVYRWTEREIEKTIGSYAPFAPHRFRYSYSHDSPCTPGRIKKGVVKTLFVNLMKPCYYLFSKIFPKQQNLFACFIEKPGIKKDHYKWLKYRDGKLTFNEEWAGNYYR